jgi:hypothetical protein
VLDNVGGTPRRAHRWEKRRLELQLWRKARLWLVSTMAGDGAASVRRQRGVARSGGLGCFGSQMRVGIRWRAATGALRAVRDMDAVWENNSGTWARAR